MHQVKASMSLLIVLLYCRYRFKNQVYIHRILRIFYHFIRQYILYYVCFHILYTSHVLQLLQINANNTKNLSFSLCNISRYYMFPCILYDTHPLARDRRHNYPFTHTHQLHACFTQRWCLDVSLLPCVPRCTF